jgi:hypothetical protein
MAVSRGQLRRGLLVLHGLTREALRRGWDVVAYRQPSGAGVAIEIREHCYPVEVHEMTETIPFTRQEIAAWRDAAWIPSERERRAGHVPPPKLKRVKLTGRLRLYLPNGKRGGRVNWTDGPRGRIEQKLPSVLRALERRAEADDSAATERAERIERLREERQARKDHARRERIDAARFQRLLSEATAWRRAADARAYLADLKRQLPRLDEAERGRVEAWHAWALDRLDSADPSRRTSLIVGIDDDQDTRWDVGRPHRCPPRGQARAGDGRR